MKSYVLMFLSLAIVSGQDHTVAVESDCRRAWLRGTEKTISVTRLRHRPPREAVSAFFRALAQADKRRWRSAASYLERAIVLDPEFSEAYSNLGVQYMSLGRAEDALAQFMRAIELDGSTSLYHSNLAYALFSLGRYAEGEREVHSALALDASNRTARFLLGWQLARHNEIDEAIRHLQYTSCAFPEAHEILAAVWTLKGDKERARQELSEYRKMGAEQVGISSAGWVSGFAPGMK